jgi:hypothetical protein
MATTEPESTSWDGENGKRYRYNVHDINFTPPANQDGNYIFAKKVGIQWKAVYIGEGNLRDRKNAAMSDGCVTRRGATHYHEHLNMSERDRFNEETDILKVHTEAYQTSGCNDKKGG